MNVNSRYLFSLTPRLVYVTPSAPSVGRYDIFSLNIRIEGAPSGNKWELYDISTSFDTTSTKTEPLKSI